MTSVVRRLAAFLRTQEELWERYGRRYELSGMQTRAALELRSSRDA